MQRVPTFPHTFVDGPGNTASGEEVMDNLAWLRDAYNDDSDIGLALPNTPDDGQEFNLVVEDGLVWKVRYRAASSLPYKWEFVGGGAHAGVEATDVNAAGAHGPTLGLPYDGIFVVTYGHETYISGGAGDSTLTLRQNGAGVSGPADGSGGDPGVHYSEDAADRHASLLTVAEVILVAGDVQLTLAATGDGHSHRRTMSILPRCIG